MSIHKSYFSKNNTLIYNSSGNTGLNPVTELFFGGVENTLSTPGFSRFIFDIDLSQLNEKVNNGTIYTGSPMTHVLKMTNTLSFNYGLLNTETSDNRKRASSFDLIVSRIPKTSGDTGLSQNWDEGVGYDYYNTNNINSSNSSLTYLSKNDNDKNYSNRASNWYSNSGFTYWSNSGIYDNTDNGTLNFSSLTMVNSQHFSLGNENIEIDITNEINNILSGLTTGSTGWIISYTPDVENITGLTENYSVGFYTRHTQTFYEPYIETTYDDLILDDRNYFFENKVNKLYLYVYTQGALTNLDETPIIDIYNPNDELMEGYSGLTTIQKTEGVYEATIPSITGYTTPTMFNDVWKNLKINGLDVGNITNEFVLRPFLEYYEIGVTTKNPIKYGFSFSGIKQDEKILNTDMRKVVVNIKQAYSSNIVLPQFKSYYRVYVKEGNTEVLVQDWTRMNQTPNEYYFMFDTRDKIPNEYYVDIKVLTSGEIDTYKRQLKFQIVNQK